MKEIKLKNHNNKLACNYFGYIALAPPVAIQQSDLIKQFIFKCQDDTLPEFVAERILILRFELCDLHEDHAYLCFGMDRTEAIKNMLEDKRHDLKSKMAIYIFRKV